MAIILKMSNKISNTHCDAISGLKVGNSGACRNPGKPLQPLTSYIIKSETLYPDFSRSD